jgi:hypothetical protein
MLGLNIKLKLVCIFCFILSLSSILMAYFYPAHGYELSLYESTPSIVWICLIFSIFGGISIIVHAVYRDQIYLDNFWRLGLLILLFDRIILLYIPYIRGYYSWRGDNIFHFGIIKDILINGSIPPDLIYPITHILLSELVYITGISTEFLGNHSTALISIFYAMSIYLLATSSLITKREQILASTSIACVLFNGYDVFLMPNGWSILYFPIVLFFYIKSLNKEHTVEYSILFTIVLILYPFFHPLSSFLLIFTLVIIGVSGYLIHVVKNRNYLISNMNFFPITTILLEVVIFSTWVFSFQKFNLNLRIMYNSITQGSSPNVIASMNTTLNKLSLSMLEIIDLSIKAKGTEFIFLMLFLSSIIILLRFPDARKNNRFLVILLSITSCFALLYISYLFNIIHGLEAIGAERLEAYFVIFTPIFAGFALSFIISRKITIHKFNISPIICIIVILIASILSICNLYPSPYVKQPGFSITQMDMDGTEWYLNFKNTATNNVYIMSSIYGFAAGAFGSTESQKILGSDQQTILPNHFNYTVSNNLGSSYTQNKYCMITMFDRTVYDTVWKVVGRFNKNDFNELEKDFSVDKLYSNGETDVVFIRAHPKTNLIPNSKNFKNIS